MYYIIQSIHIICMYVQLVAYWTGVRDTQFVCIVYYTIVALGCLFKVL